MVTADACEKEIYVNRTQCLGGTKAGTETKKRQSILPFLPPTLTQGPKARTGSAGGWWAELFITFQTMAKKGSGRSNPGQAMEGGGRRLGGR